jgi:hypothetical protein
MKHVLPVLAAAAGLLLVPGRAEACMIADAQEALIHSALPTPLPRGTIVADVLFEDANENRLHHDGIRVRIRRLIQGDVHGTTMIVRQRLQSSCDNPFANGTAGLIVAIPVETLAGETVVAPIAVTRIDRYRLPDGFQLRAPAAGAVRLRL